MRTIFNEPNFLGNNYSHVANKGHFLHVTHQSVYLSADAV